MEFHIGNTNSDETTTPVTSFHGGEKFDPNLGVYGWSEEFNCKTIYGYLAPSPLSMVPLFSEEEDEEESEPRTTEESEELLLFKVYRFIPHVVKQFLLEMHEVRTGHVERSHLLAVESDGKWKVEVWDLVQDTHEVFPVREDPFMLGSPPKHNLSFQDRLSGWTVKKRKRGSRKEDKFYYHRDIKFRSFEEVATFILYSTKSKKELKNVIQK